MTRHDDKVGWSTTCNDEASAQSGGAEPACKVRLIDEEFKRMMFDVKGV